MFPCSEGPHEAWAPKSLDGLEYIFFLHILTVIELTEQGFWLS